MQRFLQLALDFLGGPDPERLRSAPAPQVDVAAAPALPMSQVFQPATWHHPRANRTLRLGPCDVAYEFKRGKRRTIGFVVSQDGLVVRAPNWVPLYEVDAALQEKAAWVVKKLGETRERHQRLALARIEWCDGTTLPFLGVPLQVVLDPSHSFGLGGAQLQNGLSGQTLQVALAHNATPAQIRDAVQAWLMRQARKHFIERLDHFAPPLQVQWRKLALSNANTRWGSARIDGSIRLNWRLIHMRPAIIDYVVAHELSHLRAMDHSPRFWDTVRSVVPDYADLRGQLKEVAVPRWD